MLLETVYIQGLRKLLEGSGSQWKVIEGSRSQWNRMEVSGKRENSP